MRTYFFHCTNGGAIVPDRIGSRLASYPAIRDRAAQVLLDVVEADPATLASAWLVCVHDEHGRQLDVYGGRELFAPGAARPYLPHGGWKASRVDGRPPQRSLEIRGMGARQGTSI